MLRRHQKLRPDDRSDERGAALVEFAIVASLILTLGFGTYEMGTAWSDSQLVTQAARSGARVSTQLGINTSTDSFTVQSIEAAVGDLDGAVDRIVIYKANAPDGAIPPACETAAPPGIPGQCSVYDATYFGTYGTWVDGAWPPATRLNDLNSSDHVGVRVEVSRPLVTGFLGNTDISMVDTAVMRIEPNAGD